MSRILKTLSRRMLLGGGGAFAGTLLLGRSSAARAAPRAALHSLILGANDYPGRVCRTDKRSGRPLSFGPIRKLEGCLNDIDALRRAATPISASVTVLADAELKRDSVFSAWRQTLARCQAGDTILLTYSGHGSQEAAGIPGSEADGLDETLMLPSFDASRGRSAERIVDDEIAGMLQAANAKQVFVVFLADCCHSGTMTRSVSNLAQPSLRFQASDLVGVLEAGLQEAENAAGEPELPNVIYLSGCQDNQVVPELVIEGRIHGAMSMALARALSGAADTNRDGVVSAAELSTYVLTTARLLCDATQNPKVTIWPNQDVRSGRTASSPVFYLPRGGQTAPAASPSDTEPEVSIAFLNLKDRSRLTSLLRWRAPRPGEKPRLTYDGATRAVMDEMGQIFAYDIGVDQMQGAIDRVLAVDRIKQLAARAPTSVSLILKRAPAGTKEDQTYVRGTEFVLQVDAPRYPYYAVFNLAGTGHVQFLGPGSRDAPKFAVGKASVLGEGVRVQEPYGADHVVVVTGRGSLAGLVTGLQKMHDKLLPLQAAEAVEAAALADQVEIGMKAVYTMPGG